MGVNQQKSIDTATTKGNIIQLLQSSIEQGNTGNNTSVDSNFDAVDTRILRRSKRVVVELEVILFLKSVWDLGIELKDTFFPGENTSL